MSQDNKSLWHFIAEKITDDHRVDWEQLEAKNESEEKLISQFKSIEQLIQQQNNQLNQVRAERQPSYKVLFEWGHLQAIEKIGEGSYGDVYRCYDSMLDRNVALKVLKDGSLAKFQARAFIQEARRLAKVRNRFVLAVHGANIFDGKVGMWSDLIQGNTLADASVPVSAKDLLKMAEALANAVQAVHQAGLIHGDIKPSNVMEDGQGNLILMDFGTGIDLQNDITRDELMAGSPLFMAPELFDGQKLSPKADMYSLGVLLYYLASGKYPVIGSSMIELAQNHQCRNQLKRLKGQLSKQLANLILSMLSSEPKSRPSAEQILQKIQQIKTAPQRRTKRLGLMVVFTTLILGTLFSSHGYYQAKKAQAQTQIEKEKAQTVNDFLTNMLNSAASLGTGREVRVADLIDVAALNVEDRLKQQPHIRAAIHDALGNSLNALQLPQDAYQQLSKGLEIKQKIYGVKHPETLETMLKLIFSTIKFGDNQQAIRLSQQLIDLAETNKETNSTLIKKTTIRLAEIYADMGENDKAERMLKQVIAELEQSQKGFDNTGYLAKNALASVYLGQSRYVDAEVLAGKIIKELKQWPEAKNSLIPTLTTLAIVMTRQGKLKEAEAAFREIVAISEEIYGAKNYGYLQALINLGGILQERGKLDEAHKIQTKTLELTSQVQGDNHMMTLSAGMNLSNTKVTMGDYEGGEQLLRKVLEKGYSSLGKDNITVLVAEYNLAELLNKTGRYTDAEELAQSTHKKMISKLGEHHLYTLLAQDNIAVSWHGLGQFVEAEKLFLQLISQLEKNVGEKSPYTLMVRQHLIATLISSNQKTKAKKALEQLLLLQQQTLGETHDEVVKTMEQLNRLFN